MLTTLKDDLYSPYITMLSGENPLVCLDNRFCVVRAEEKFQPGERLLDYITETVPEPLSVVMETALYHGERFCCCRIYPIKNDLGESVAYICELISAESARRISERTEAPSDALPLYNAVEMNLSSVWRSAAALREQLHAQNSFAGLPQITAIESAVSNISAAFGNAFHYADMLYNSQKFAPVDAGALCRTLVQRCNAALAKCGRRVEAVIEPEDLTIYADSRRAVVALVNAVQNALLYSPQDSEPILAAYRKEERGRWFVEIRITNENSMFTSRDFSDGTEVNFSYQRLGYGIPLIKRFASVSGGRFSMQDENGRVIVTITLPAAQEPASDIITMRSSLERHYDAGVPDFTDVMMREVVLFFGEKTGEKA
ncbi:MAG: hypothetical protein ACI4WS_08715 [Oscillospiraceae bacterium]